MTTPYSLPRSERTSEWQVGDGRVKYGPFRYRIFDVADVEVRIREVGQGTFEKIDVLVEKTSGAAFDTFTVTFPFPVPAILEYQVRGVRVQERLSDQFRGGSIVSNEVEKIASQEAVVLQELRRDISEVMELTDEISQPEFYAEGAKAARDEARTEKDSAEDAADRAEAAAASLNLPLIGVGDAGKVLAVKPDGSAYETTLVDDPKIAIPLTPDDAVDASKIKQDQRELYPTMVVRLLRR